MKKIFLGIISVVSAAVIPLLITMSLITFMFLNPDFHVSIIKNLNLVKTFIEAKNFEIESDIKREIEKKTGIVAYKPEYDRIKKDYEEKLLAFNTINKTEVYTKTEKQIDELDDLEWEKSPDTFKNETDFDIFKKHKMKELKSALKEIKKYRDDNEDAIDRAEDDMNKSEDLFEDADDEMKDKEKEARQIIEKRQDDFMNEIYHDVAKIEPALTEKLNKLFIEKEIRNIIRSYLAFFTSYNEQKKNGNIYESRLNVESGIIENTKKIILPPFRMSFIVKVNDNGIEREKNLLSELFVETIRDTPGLKSPWVMTKIFSLSDSWIVETIGNALLKDAELAYSGGIVKSGPIILTGKKAEIVEKAMICMSAARYIPYAAAAVSVILLLVFLLSSGGRSGLKNAGYILKYPSMVIAITGLTAILLSLVPGLLIPEIVSDPVKYAFLERVTGVATLHIFAPVTVLFFLISLAGSLMVKLGKR